MFAPRAIKPPSGIVKGASGLVRRSTAQVQKPPLVEPSAQVRRGASWDFGKIPLFPRGPSAGPPTSPSPAVHQTESVPELTVVVAKSNDPLEREASRVAEQVQAKSAIIPTTGPELQHIFSGAASGSPSSIPFRKAMEFSFGEDFSSVKAYLGQRQSMDRLNAYAAASGDQVVFGGSSPDKKLVAHELTHVVQQRRFGAGQLKSQLSSVDEAAEREADGVASRAASGQRVAVSAAPGSAVQRDIKDKKLDVPFGHFEIDMTAAEIKGGDTGEEGNISFTSNDKAPELEVDPAVTSRQDIRCR